jgi:heat shock protein HslJ
MGLGVLAALLALPLAAAGAGTAPFVARGNEPGWRVEIGDAAVTFQAMGEEILTIAPKPEAKRAAGAETYSASVDGKPFALAIADLVCVDTMSGMPFPKTVSITLGEKTYSGCGGDPASLLEGEWLIEEIGGKAIVAESKPSMNFGPDGKLSGNGSCNRYFGPYALTGEGLKISNLASSMMACEQPLMDQERLLLKRLQETTRFEINQAGRLVLLGDDDNSVVARRK